MINNSNYELFVSQIIYLVNSKRFHTFYVVTYSAIYLCHPSKIYPILLRRQNVHLLHAQYRDRKRAPAPFRDHRNHNRHHDVSYQNENKRFFSLLSQFFTNKTKGTKYLVQSKKKHSKIKKQQSKVKNFRKKI